MSLQSKQIAGFTLIEMVMVMVLIGIVGSIVAVFIKTPVDAYFASARRAGISDTADTVLRRVSRDLRKALPNSVRVPNAQCMELIPTKTGGRYRLDGTAAGLDFAAADTSFNMLGSNSTLPSDQRIATGDLIVVYNLGITGSNAYNNDNTSAVTATPTQSGTPIETTLAITAKQFPLESGGNRFHVVDKDERVVAFVCTGGNLYRTVNVSSFASSCPTTGAILATKVSACSFDYGGTDLQSNAVARITLQLTDGGETVSLTHTVNINNTP
jgi:MSHA biogenesis protein MshO